MPEGLTFTIHPDNQTSSVDLFVKAMDDIRRLLNDVGYAVHRNRVERRWIVAELRSSAPTVTVTTLLGDEESLLAVSDGIREVANGTDRPPEFFTEPVLEDLKRMRRHFRGRDKARSIEVALNGDVTATIQEDIGEQADRILRAGYWNLGSVEGALEALNFHGAATFTVWDRVSRAPVRCSLADVPSGKERVRELLEKRVRVTGRVRYFQNGVPRSVVDIRDIQDATPDPNLPKAGFGSIPDVEAARDPVAFLRAVRGLDGDI